MKKEKTKNKQTIKIRYRIKNNKTNVKIRARVCAYQSSSMCSYDRKHAITVYIMHSFTYHFNDSFCLWGEEKNIAVPRLNDISNLSRKNFLSCSLCDTRCLQTQANPARPADSMIGLISDDSLINNGVWETISLVFVIVFSLWLVCCCFWFVGDFAFSCFLQFGSRVGRSFSKILGLFRALYALWLIIFERPS